MLNNIQNLPKGLIKPIILGKSEVIGLLAVRPGDLREIEDRSEQSSLSLQLGAVARWLKQT